MQPFCKGERNQAFQVFVNVLHARDYGNNGWLYEYLNRSYWQFEIFSHHHGFIEHNWKRIQNIDSSWMSHGERAQKTFSCCFNFMFIHEFNQFLISFVTMQKKHSAKKASFFWCCMMLVLTLTLTTVDIDTLHKIASSMIGFWF